VKILFSERRNLYVHHVGVAHVFTVLLFTIVLIVFPISSAFGYCWHGQEKECYVFLMLSWMGLPYWSLVLVVLSVNWGYWND